MYFFWFITILLLVVLATAILTLHERKVIADIQSSSGPSKVGFFGILQPMADAVKLLLKEYIVPFRTEQQMFSASAVMAFMMAAVFWNMPTLSLYNVSILNEMSMMYTFLMSMVHVFAVLFAGWASKNSYGFMGSMSGSAQLIAYDIVMMLVYVQLFFFTKEFSYESFCEMQEQLGCMLVIYLPMQAMMFFIAQLCETTSHPFDFPEAESELVSGFNTEYSGISFALFFLAEYATVLYASMMVTMMFFTGTFMASGQSVELIVWVLKVYIFTWWTMHASALLPSYSYDQLMEVCWKVMMPIQLFSMAWITFASFFC